MLAQRDLRRQQALRLHLQAGMARTPKHNISSQEGPRQRDCHVRDSGSRVLRGVSTSTSRRPTSLESCTARGQQMNHLLKQLYGAQCIRVRSERWASGAGPGLLPSTQPYTCVACTVRRSPLPSARAAACSISRMLRFSTARISPDQQLPIKRGFPVPQVLSRLFLLCSMPILGQLSFDPLPKTVSCKENPALEPQHSTTSHSSSKIESTHSIEHFGSHRRPSGIFVGFLVRSPISPTTHTPCPAESRLRGRQEQI
jgi:hypothetical protein